MMCQQQRGSIRSDHALRRGKSLPPQDHTDNDVRRARSFALLFGRVLTFPNRRTLRSIQQVLNAYASQQAGAHVSNEDLARERGCLVSSLSESMQVHVHFSTF